MIFGNWTVGSLYRSWSLKTMVKRISEIDWICCKYSKMGQGNTTQAEDCTFLFQLEKEMEVVSQREYFLCISICEQRYVICSAERSLV